MRKLFDVLSSLGLACVLLILLGLLTWLGTLEQVDHGLFETQKKYFESFVLTHDFGGFVLPLPGANLVLTLLFVNLFMGGVIRIRKGWRMSGILITHAGILMLLLSGFVKLYYSQDGHVTLFEGDSASEFQSYYRWELVITEETPGGLRQWRVPQEQFTDAPAAIGAVGEADVQDLEPVRLVADELPFELELSHFMPNSQPLPKGPMFEVDVPVVDGFFLREEDKDAEAERNVAGLYATALLPDGTRQRGILHGWAAAPWTVSTDEGRFALQLRKERYPMPFAVILDKFTKEDHPGISMARSFSSDVTVVEDGTPRRVRIEMNHPLRDGGLVLYQASWGPADARPGTPLFSTLSVVRNPADQWPKWACWVIFFGLVIHFGLKLNRYVKREMHKATT